MSVRPKVEPESDEESLASTIVQTPWYLGGEMYGGPEDTLDPPDPVNTRRDSQQTPPSFEGRRYSPVPQDIEAVRTPVTLEVRPSRRPVLPPPVVIERAPALKSLALSPLNTPLIDEAIARSALRSSDSHAGDTPGRGRRLLTGVLILGVAASVLATLFAYAA
ncbi:MAG: hypothetical protein AB8H79_24035 [Myxococcota bacterium]